MQHYVYLIRLVDVERGKNPDETDRDILARHFKRLQDRLRASQLVMAGPCLDYAFGIVIFKAGSPEEAETFMQNDPAVAEGLMTAELHPMHITLLAENPAPLGLD